MPEWKGENDFKNITVARPGVLAIEASKWNSYSEANREIQLLAERCEAMNLKGFPLIVVVDDARFVAETLSNFLWVTFTRTNPSHDVYGVQSFTENKHWGCRGSLIIDARIKTHHAPPVEKDPEIERRVDQLGALGGSLHGVI